MTTDRRTAVTAQVAETRRALLQLRDRDRMLDEACRLAVELGGFRMAWIGWVEGDAIRPVVIAGDDDGYVGQVAATVHGEAGRGPTGTAVREHRPALCQDIESDPAMERWREAARRLGYRSSAAFPLSDGDVVLGVLCVYATEPDVFDQETVEDLAELADDVAAAVAHHDEHERRVAAERRYHELFDQISDGVFRTGLDGEILEANPAMAHILGYYSVPHFLSEVANTRELYVEPGARDQMIDELRATGQLHAYETRYRRRDGTVAWLSLTARMLHDDDGQPSGLEGIATDVTERKRAEDAIHGRDAILTAVSGVLGPLLAEEAAWHETIQEGLAKVGAAAGADRAALIEVVVDDEGRPAINRPYAWAAPGVESLLEDPRIEGLAYEEAGYAPWAAALAAGETLALHHTDFDETQRVLLDALGTKTLLFAPIHVGGEWWGTINLERVTTDEPWSPIETDALVTAGRALGAAIARDRAEQAVAEAHRELEAYAEELARSNQELEQFAYVASHDLQEPLRMVTSFVQLLDRKYAEKLDDQAREYIAYAVDGASRMQQLINDLLVFSRVGTRGEPLAPVDLATVTELALRDLRTTLEEVDAQVTVGELPKVVGDATQLRQVMGNLLSNAVKFRGEGPPVIDVRTERDGDQWVVSVADEGIGIDPIHADRVFILFQRLHTRDEFPGTGIGLALCRKIVERHGGRIWVEPNEPQGSVFRFTLPTAEVSS